MFMQTVDVRVDVREDVTMNRRMDVWVDGRCYSGCYS